MKKYVVTLHVNGLSDRRTEIEERRNFRLAGTGGAVLPLARVAPDLLLSHRNSGSALKSAVTRSRPGE